MHYKKHKKTIESILKLPVKDWLVSHIILDLAVEAILHRVKINRSYDIPYLAGYSKSGKTIYIDRHMPTTFLCHGTIVKIDRFLILHEAIEKTLIDKLGLHYQFAHQIALRAEQDAVRADNISWKEYDTFMQTYIKELGDERIKRVPKNLDIKPYYDEHDKVLLERMKQAMRRKN